MLRALKKTCKNEKKKSGLTMQYEKKKCKIYILIQLAKAMLGKNGLCF